MLYTFKEWLFESEFSRFIEDVMNTMMTSNNMQFNRLLGVSQNWFSIILGQAKKYAEGGELENIVSTVSSELLMSLHKKEPTDNFYTAMANIMQKPEPEKVQEMVKLFTTAAALRARRAATGLRSRSKIKTVSMSALDKTSAGDVPDETSPDNAEDRMESLRRGIMMELERMRQNSNDSRSRERLELAKQVAEKMMENPPNIPTLPDLMAMFPGTTKGTMHNIRQDVQAAAATVAAHRGMDTTRLQRKSA